MTNVLELLKEFQPKGILTEYKGDKNAQISRIAAIEDCGPGDLVFADKKDYITTISSKSPTAVVTSPSLASQFQSLEKLTVLVAPNVGLAHALIKQRHGARSYAATGWDKIHASAVIHETAQVDPTTVVEPRVVIGKNAKIGRDCRIMAGSVIENDVTIGNNTIVHPAVVIGYKCQIGNDVVVGSGSVIGSEGYGFAQDEKKRSYQIPQTGIVVIEDRVRVGANNCIDRAAYHTTRIGAGTKLDNLCHIAHNVQIGEDCLLTSMLCVAGSSKIGDRVITSGQTGILDHMNVCSDTVLLHRAGVSKDIEKPGAYAGYPLLPLSDYMKNMAVFRNLAEFRKRLNEIEKKI